MLMPGEQAALRAAQALAQGSGGKVVNGHISHSSRSCLWTPPHPPAPAILANRPQGAASPLPLFPNQVT